MRKKLNLTHDWDFFKSQYTFDRTTLSLNSNPVKGYRFESGFPWSWNHFHAHSYQRVLFWKFLTFHQFPVLPFCMWLFPNIKTRQTSFGILGLASNRSKKWRSWNHKPRRINWGLNKNFSQRHNLDQWCLNTTFPKSGCLCFSMRQLKSWQGIHHCQ